MPMPTPKPLSPNRLAVLLTGLALVFCALADTREAHALRLAGRAFDVAAEIEVLDLPSADAEAAITAAFAEIDLTPLELRALEAAAATGRPVVLEPRARALVERALGFCYWSEGVVGPLGGEIYRLLGLRTPVAALPTPEALGAAIASARCENAVFDPVAATLTVAPGSRVDFFPFELGWAVDRAVELLKSRGVTNFEVVLGPVRRAVGSGALGTGWRVDPPPAPGLGEPLAPVYLRERALTLFAPSDRPLRIAGDAVVPYVDHRSARTVGNVAQVFVVAELGVDANALAYAMFALGPSEGMLRVGGLTPRPSIRWLLGSGEGPPVITDHNWSAVPRH